MDKIERVQVFDQTELLHLCSLSAGNLNWKDALDDIYQQAREKVIFDNLVIYQTDFNTHRLEVLFARATGRGKNAEADASWGEVISNRVINESRIIIENPVNPNGTNRLESPFLLGIPIYSAAELPGVLVFIRFGGPEYSDQDINNARFLSDLTTSVLRKKCIEEFNAKLKDEKIISLLQSDFINTISHELRSPLGFIKGYTTTLLRKDAKWDQATQDDFLEIIERETNNLSDLIEDLLDSSRLESGHMKFDFQPVRLDSLIRDEVNRSLLAKPDQKITLDFEPEIPAIHGDTRRLAQVFDNLLSNASKYAPGEPIVISLTKKQKYLHIEFADSGSGIPVEFLPNMFTRFFRVPEPSMKVHGSGLGLFICKQIITSHEGTISVTSSEKGTIFIIDLPFEMSIKNG